ncbi:MAG TPA: hypothetical protein VIV40_41345 [Kofleriaceae bacterium]
MTTLPDWLVERAALDEVAPVSRDRVDRADPRELAERIAAVRADNLAELEAHPAGPALAIIERRAAAESNRLVARRRRQRLGWLGVLSTAAAAAVVLVLVIHRPATEQPAGETGSSFDDGERVKGTARLLAFRQVGDRAERLEQDALVQAGDLIQLRYNAGGQRYGMIASVDGAGVVTLHFPFSDKLPPEATALAAKPTALPHAYELDAAPSFERFFFITADAPIDVQHSLAALRSFAARADSATASLELVAGVHQWSLRLRKPERPSTNQESPTP